MVATRPRMVGSGAPIDPDIYPPLSVDFAATGKSFTFPGVDLPPGATEPLEQSA